jgi:hypothetical protein
MDFQTTERVAAARFHHVQHDGSPRECTEPVDYNDDIGVEGGNEQSSREEQSGTWFPHHPASSWPYYCFRGHLLLACFVLMEDHNHNDPSSRPFY